MKNVWRAGVLAWQFFTILPAPKVERPSQMDMSRSALFLPLVGFVLGLILVGCRDLFLFVLPAPAATFLALVVFTFCSGGLHIDGLMDTFDAIGSRRVKAEALAIMKDSRVGAIGALAAIVLICGKWIAMAGEPPYSVYPFILVPVLSRLSMLWSMVTAPSATNKGLGSLFTGQIRPVYVVVVSAVVLSASVIYVPIFSVAVVFVVFYIAVALMSSYFINRFGGMTGDTFGALAEIVEFILFFAVLACVSHPLSF